MDNRLMTFEYLRKYGQTGVWAVRIVHELGYMLEVSRMAGFAYDDRLLPQLERLKKAVEQDGAITKQLVQEVEAELADLSAAAKSYDVTCVSHAHIDMNWLWGFSETVSLTVDTFRTMLKLLKEYPQFIFSQSQASTYHIIEQYAPEMLDEIRKYVKEGRWELMASSWVENDKNMTGAEASARHLLYTRRYLSELFDVPEDTVKVDFEPDTFGHCSMLPEVLNQGGVKYYYHCRGYDKEYLYHWKAPSGASVLAYREPKWYTVDVEPERIMHVPSFCAQNKAPHYLLVYGVGDHGGGPTRRDIERLIDMDTWPLFPTIQFGTLHSFFEKVEKYADVIPTVEGELNYVFTGCYSSQARIKRANRIGEDRLFESEVFDAMAKGMGTGHKTPSPYRNAWTKMMFNQFHDILPGSGVTETSDHALGEFHNAMGAVNVNATQAMLAMANAIDTSGLDIVEPADTAVGAGIGYGSRDYVGFRFPVCSQSGGLTRIYTLFNPTQFDREELAELTIWDWNESPAQIKAFTIDGEPLEVQVLEGTTGWWGHKFCKIGVQTKVPAFGYQSVLLTHTSRDDIPTQEFAHSRRDHFSDAPVVLENSKLRAEFQANSMQLISLVRKCDGEELVDPNNPGCTFRLITESTATQMVTDAGTEEMSAWRIGPYAAINPISQTCPITVTGVEKGKLRQTIRFNLPFGDSNIAAKVYLDKDSDVLRFEVMMSWREFGSKANGVPQLNFHLPLKNKIDDACCAVPYKMERRPAMDQDVPCNGLIAAQQGETAVSLLCDCKYGFRNDGKSLAVTLIRSPYNPEPTPEIGRHCFTLGVGVSAPGTDELIRMNECFSHPIHSCTNTVHEGKLATSGQLMQVTGVVITGVKRAEDGNGLIVRMYNPDQNHKTGGLCFSIPVMDAARVSVTEQNTNEPLAVAGNSVSIDMVPCGIATVRVIL